MSAQYSIQKVFLIVLIILLVFVFLVPSLSLYVRYNAYKMLQTGIKILLNYQTQDFNVLNSENFIIKYTEKDSDSISAIAETAEKYYTALNERFVIEKQAEKILIVIFPNQKTLNRSFGLTGDKSIDGAYWAGSIRLLSMSGSIDELPISHELTHLLIDEKTRGNYTRWLSEGLAQYYEAKLAGYNLDEPLPEEKKNLYTLDQLGSDFDKRENQLLAYWQSLQTVNYLIERFGLEKMHELLDTLGQGTNTDSAFELIYGLKIKELEKQTADWISGE